MEDMEINSKISYKRDRVMSGNEPHRILQMIQEQALEKELKIESMRTVIISDKKR